MGSNPCRTYSLLVREPIPPVLYTMFTVQIYRGTVNGWQRATERTLTKDKAESLLRLFIAVRGDLHLYRLASV